MKRTLFISISVFIIAQTALSQATEKSYHPIQFSGRVVIEQNGKLDPLPYTNIAVKGTPRGTSSSIDGFFSLVVLPGEKVLFSRLGFELEQYIIPIEILSATHSKIIVLKQDTLLLPDILIYPWPNRDFFKIEFLALEVDEELEEIAQENLSPEKLARLREALPSDGREVAGIELRQLSQAYYYEGQIKPQNIFNPLSWKKFIDAIKRGDFKKKNTSSE
ncbi:MAG: carboxypeptidase-like regulatory domain-containing protein [Saprospiraceae bacterium]